MPPNAGPALLALATIAALLASSQLAHILVNWVVTVVAVPQPLPRMDFASGIPAPQRTLVVVPTLLTSLAGVERLVDALEVRFLANRDPHLHFGLLTDFPDAPTQTLPGDEALLSAVAQRIGQLNEKYPRAAGGDAFFLFHRPRRWNAPERTWMGYERKRGKLGELNALLRGKGLDRFDRLVGRIEALREVRYVITLDTDTDLPRDAARAIVGTLAHPLNRAHYDQRSRRVAEGYGILQPRVAVSLPGASRSRYARLHGGDAGIDPYTRAVSDVYQDLFGEGSFIGKGIYDVDAFEQALADGLPDNRILSHDLLEGCYARAGLVSDVELYEDFPARTTPTSAAGIAGSAATGRSRAGCCRACPVRGRAACPIPLSALSRWKILDNLRRSLVSSGLTALAARWAGSRCRRRRPGPWSWPRSCWRPPRPACCSGCTAGPTTRTGASTWRCCCARPGATWRRRRSPSRAWRTRRTSASTRSCAPPSGCWSRGAGCSSGRPRASSNGASATASRNGCDRCGDRPRSPRGWRCCWRASASRPCRARCRSCCCGSSRRCWRGG